MEPASRGGKREIGGVQQNKNQRDRTRIAGSGGDLGGDGKLEEGREGGKKDKKERDALDTTSKGTTLDATSSPESRDSSSVISNGSRAVESKESRPLKRPSSARSRESESLSSRDTKQPALSQSSTMSRDTSGPAPSSRPKSALEAIKSASSTPSQSRESTPPASRDPASRPTASRDSEHLLPTTIFPCPATVPQRIAYLKAIHTALTSKRKLKFPKRAAILEELAAAKRSGGNYMVYTNECRVLVKSIKDGSWRGGNAKEGAKTGSGGSGGITASISNQLNAMATKIKPLLAQNGYPINPDPKRSGLPSNIGIQHCDRCNKAFDVPKVDNYGSCKYHWARPRLGGNTNMPEKFYPCCNQPVGMSEGCEEASRHVYKLHDLNDLAFAVPFKKVPDGLSTSDSSSATSSASSGLTSSGGPQSTPRPGSTPNGGRRPRTVFNGPSVAQREPDVTLETMRSGGSGSRDQTESRDQSEEVTPPPVSVVALDCEMLYTSLGMELCRVTCVDYNGRKTLDRVVRPTGRILDYNTRFSGISDINEPIITETGEKGGSISFEEAHKLIFKLINKETVLVGHGLENDLIAMRLVHDRIVDTSILYPDFNPKYKTALKTLALKYLKRTIQTGEHDSMEDALAALDVVKCHLKS